MICPKCGHQMEENSNFCTNCGNKVVNEVANNPQQTPENSQTNNNYQEQYNTTPNMQNNNYQNNSFNYQNSTDPNMQQNGFNNMANNINQNESVKTYKNVIKGFFSKDTLDTLYKSIYSNGKEWVLLLLTYVIVFAISGLVVASKAYSGLGGLLARSYMSTAQFNIIAFFTSIFTSAILFFSIAVMVFITLKFALKKNISFTNVLNFVSVVFLVHTLSSLLGIILIFINTSLVQMVSSVAQIIVGILLYLGMKKIVGDKKTFIHCYALMWIVYNFIVFIVSSLILGSMFGSASSMLGSFGSLLK